MDRQHDRDFDRVFNFARSSLYIQPLSDTMAAALDEDGLGVDPDEPPDQRLTPSSLIHTTKSESPASTQIDIAKVYNKKSTAPMIRQSSLLTEGLLTAANLKDIPMSQHAQMARAGSQASAYSLTSNHGLTSDGGFSSPAHSGTPSPPLPPAMQTGIVAPTPKMRSIKFAGEKPAEPITKPDTDKPKAEAKPEIKPRKTCISFACAPVLVSNGPQNVFPSARPAEQPQRACTIKFACAEPPTEASKTTIRQAPSPVPVPGAELQSTPKPLAILASSVRRPRGSQSTIVDGTIAAATAVRVSSGAAVSPTQIRKLEKKRRAQITGIRPEDEDWMNDEPKVRKPITVSDTLRKEEAIRKLAEEAAREIDEDYDIDDIVDEDEEDRLPATGSRYMAYDEDESDGGHETDDEEGFAASDDESDDDPDFQFWTTSQSTAATLDEQQLPEMLKPQHHRTTSDSSLDSQLRFNSSKTAPRLFLSGVGRRRKSPKEAKMRPGTPELPDSTDFVCGTLDEDRPLEEAYLSCIKQRKLEKRGIIPQDLDPSFPTSDPENVDEDEEDEVTEGLASTASEQHFLGGRFDLSDDSQRRGRNIVKKTTSPNPTSPRRIKSPAPKPRHKAPALAAIRSRVKSPAPPAVRSRAKSPAPPAVRSRVKSPAPPAVRSRAKSPAPRMLFGRSPLRARSPAPGQHLISPPASPKGIPFKAPMLAQRRPFRTASLPHTPNPFFVAHARKMRAAARRQDPEPEGHDRGPIDIKQGLEARKQRRKEQYWRKHCRDHKDKSRRCAPGKGAERMRELGLEMAHRNRAYGQKLQLMLSA